MGEPQNKSHPMMPRKEASITEITLKNYKFPIKIKRAMYRSIGFSRDCSRLNADIIPNFDVSEPRRTTI